MRIIHISDTHSQHRKISDLPAGDVVIHSGDFSFAGTEDEALDFIDWFSSLPYKHKIFISGNHDNSMYDAEIEGLPDNCYYLCNSGVTIEGIRFYGVPMFMEDIIFGNYDSNISAIPDDTDILITHQPPYGVLDFSENIHYGDNGLLEAISKVRPKYHLFGHIHNAHGVVKTKDTTFINASMVNDDYVLINNAHTFDI